MKWTIAVLTYSRRRGNVEHMECHFIVLLTVFKEVFLKAKRCYDT